MITTLDIVSSLASQIHQLVSMEEGEQNVITFISEK